MAVIYIASAVLILIIKYQMIPAAFVMIVKGAFKPMAATGDFAGSTVMLALRYGLSRGTASNEAGMGSAPFAMHPHKRIFLPDRDYGVYTIATAIADPLLSYNDDGTHTLQAIYASRGAAISVSEEDIKNSRSLLAKQEGIFCEASSAVSYAAYKKDSESGCISKDDKTVYLITGHGLKQKTSY
mgnify:CR=1 FL=1